MLKITSHHLIGTCGEFPNSSLTWAKQMLKLQVNQGLQQRDVILTMRYPSSYSFFSASFNFCEKNPRLSVEPHPLLTKRRLMNGV